MSGQRRLHIVRVNKALRSILNPVGETGRRPLLTLPHPCRPLDPRGLAKSRRALRPGLNGKASRGVEGASKRWRKPVTTEAPATDFAGAISGRCSTQAKLSSITVADNLEDNINDAELDSRNERLIRQSRNSHRRMIIGIGIPIIHRMTLRIICRLPILFIFTMRESPNSSVKML